MENYLPSYELEEHKPGVYRVTSGDQEFYVTPLKGSCYSCFFSMFINGSLHCLFRKDHLTCDTAFERCNEDGIMICPCCKGDPELGYVLNGTLLKLFIACRNCGLAISRESEIGNNPADTSSELTKIIVDLWNTRPTKYNYDMGKKDVDIMDKPQYNYSKPTED